MEQLIFSMERNNKLTNFTKLSFRNLVEQNMKVISKGVVSVALAVGMSLLLQGCFASKNSCGCDLNKKNAPPRSHKHNIY